MSDRASDFCPRCDGVGFVDVPDFYEGNDLRKLLCSTCNGRGFSLKEGDDAMRDMPGHRQGAGVQPDLRNPE